MENVVLTSATQISPKAGCPLSSQIKPAVTDEPATTVIIESNVENPPEFVEPTELTEPIEQSDVDGNFQAKMDLNYQAHDVALATAKANGHEQSNGLKHSQHIKMDIDDVDEHPDKVKSPCSTVNALLMALAIVCFALFLCSIGVIVSNREDKSNDNRRSPLKILGTYKQRDLSIASDELINEPYFNLTSRLSGGIIVVLSRRGASVNDILIPYTDSIGIQQYRSIVVKDNQFGSIRFGFDGNSDSMNMDYQLPSTYPYLNSYDKDWSMYGDINAPYRIRFVYGLAEIVYEFSSSNRNELIMTTFVSSSSNEQIVADPTNNIYFNLRGDGNLSTHYLNLSASTPTNIENGQKLDKNQLIQGQYVDQLKDMNNYFYTIDRAGIGKNYIATLTESETKRKLHIFSDHYGIIIDTYIVESSDDNKTMSVANGIRISPRQSPAYEATSNYGPILIVYPSQAIHTTWWQFEY